jgi:hypothetical protein
MKLSRQRLIDVCFDSDATRRVKVELVGRMRSCEVELAGWQQNIKCKVELVGGTTGYQVELVGGAMRYESLIRWVLGVM